MGVPQFLSTKHSFMSTNRLVMSDSLRPHGLQPTRLLCPWGFSRQEFWSGLPCLPPGDLPKPGIKPRSPALQADSLPSEPPVPASKQCLFTKNADWCSLHPSLFKVSCSSRTSPKLCPSVSSNQRTPTMSDACHKPLGTWAKFGAGSAGTGHLEQRRV